MREDHIVESLLGVAEGDYTFDLEPLAAAALARWAGSELARATGQLAQFSLGQLQILGGHSDTHLLVSLLVGGGGLGLDGDEALGSEFVAWLTSQPGFPDDGAVVITDWGAELVRLRANMSSDDLLAALD